MAWPGGRRRERQRGWWRGWRRGVAAVLIAIAAMMLAAVLAAGAFLAGGGLEVAAAAALRRVGLSDAAVAIAVAGLADDRPALRLDVAVDTGGLRGLATESALPLDGRLRLSGTVAVGWSGWALAVAPVGCLAVAVEGLTVSGEAIALPGGATLCAAADTPLLRWSPRGMVLAAEGRAPRLDLPAQGLRAERLAVTLSRTVSAQAVDVHLATLRRTAEPAEIAPLAIVARAEQAAGQLAGPLVDQPVDQAPWRFSGTATGPQGLLAATVTGTHDPLRGEGRAELRTKPLRMAPGGPGLKVVSPLLAAAVADFSGSLTAKAAVAWSAAGLRSNGQLLIEKAGGKVGAATAAGVNGTVVLSSLSPPIIPAGQTLAVALLDVGVPLTDGVLRFGYGRDRRLDVDEAVWRWAGGTLRADPFELAPAAPEGTVTLHADGLDLARILALVDVDGLDAAGTLSGILPVRIAGNRVRLDGGVLEAVGTGTLRYDPAHPPPALKGDGEGGSGALLLGALTDFRYESLRLTIDGDAGGELRAGLSVRGANPSFYDGYPVALNLKLSGALDRILRQSLDTYRIPDAVRERMTGFDHKEP